MQLPLDPPICTDVPFARPSAGDYRKAQRRMAQQRMLMRHMHMGIIMDIITDIMTDCCFIVALSLPQAST